MNNTRRKEISAIKDELTAHIEAISQLKERLEAVRDEEQEYLDNMPESMQSGEKGERAQSVIDALDSAIDTIDEAASIDVESDLETAKE